MTKKRKGMSRRQFLHGAAGAALAGSMCGLPQGAEAGEKKPAAPGSSRSKVILIRDDKAVSPDGKPNDAVLEKMLDEAVTKLTGAADPAAAWKTLIKPSDTVGIKSNEWRFLATPRALEENMRRRIVEAGVPASKIAVDDRGVLRNQVFLDATALINIRPMRTHHWSGVGSLIKNYIMFSESPPSWHDDSCADLAGVWNLPVCKGKTRLNVLVMLTPLFQSKGPHAYNAKYTWPYKGILVGTDPVAVDATGLRILQAKRLDYFGKEQPFDISPKHVAVAESKFGLGVADEKRIDLVRLGWNDGALI